MKIILCAVALLGLASATDCGKLTECVLVNLSTSLSTNVFDATGTTLSPTTMTKYDLKDGSLGWSIKCDTDGTIDYVKYFLDNDDVKTHYSTPFWIDGDNNGERVNNFDYLEECGSKAIEVELYIWSQGDDAPCDATTIYLEAVCDVAPTHAPTRAPTFAPIIAPTIAPTHAPTGAPVRPPTKAPAIPCHPITCPANSTPLAENDGCVDLEHECVCNNGFEKKNGQCVKKCSPITCPANSFPLAENDGCVESEHECVCNNGFEKKNRQCVKKCSPITCPANSFPLAENDGCLDSDHECVCNNGFEKKNGQCVKKCSPITCPANSFPLAENDGCVDSDHECVCNNGFEKKNGECVPPVSMWGCFVGPNKVGDVKIQWGHQAGDAVWACNTWNGKCGGKCEVRSTWSCKKKSSGVIISSVDLYWGHKEGDAAWACNAWAPSCNGDCTAVRKWMY